MTEEDCNKLETLLQDCRDNTSELTAWEQDFIQHFQDRVDQYGLARTRVSEKQWAILDRIADKVSAR